MAEWRLGRGWSDSELEARLKGLKLRSRNFSAPLSQMKVEHGWHEYFSEAVVARGRTGDAEGDPFFDRAIGILSQFQFSDKNIVVVHFEPSTPLIGRRMLLEIKPLRIFHFLNGVVVADVIMDKQRDRTTFSIRYETLEGHIEKGAEWFRLTKDHETGTIRFRIEAAWLPGQFPNWWSRLGFHMLAPFYQESWHRHAHAIMSQQVNHPELIQLNLGDGHVAHTGAEVTFKRMKAHEKQK